MRVEHLAEGVSVYCGDCRDVLPTLGKVDAVVTDPPFGVGNFVQTTGNKRGGTVTSNDNPPDETLFQMLRDISTHRVIWGANYFNCFEGKGALVWVKNQTMPNFSQAEVASVSWGNKVGMITLTWKGGPYQSKESDHPCERPVRLYEWSIEQIPGCPQLILDPFLGSGSSGVAAVKMGKKFIGIEREPAYFDIACRRISDALSRPDLFIAPPAVKPKQDVLL